MHEKNKNNIASVIKNLIVFFAPICFVSIIPFLMKMYRETYFFATTSVIVLESISSLVLGSLLMFIAIYVLKSKCKKVSVYLALGLCFCILNNLCYLIFIGTGINIRHLYSFVNSGDFKIGFLFISVYSILLYMKKKDFFA